MWESDDTFRLEWTGGDEYTDLTLTRDGFTTTQRVYFEQTPCRFGGTRLWFQCPGCSRRVGKIYLPSTLYVSGSSWRLRVRDFKCRHCYDLTYLQRQDRDLYWTLLHRADRLAERWIGEMAEDWIYKKKWQRWRTFHRRVDEYEALVARSNDFGLKGIEAVLKRL